MIIQTTCLYKKKHLEDKTGYPWEDGDLYSILECPACHKITVAVSSWHDGIESESEISYKVLYPSEEKLPIGLPDKIKKGYESAQKVKSIDANAYAVLMRRNLELICEDRKAEGDNLYKKLENLAAKHDIPHNLVDVAHGLRNLGNVGAHPLLGELSEKEIPILSALINAILEYVYSAPHLAQTARIKFDQLKNDT